MGMFRDMKEAIGVVRSDELPATERGVRGHGSSGR